MKKKKYYVVWEGRRPGVYEEWSECLQQIEGYQGARYKSFPTIIAAEKAYEGNFREYIRNQSPSAQQAQHLPGYPKGEALTVDAACSGNPGVMEYRGVWLHSGTEVFRMGPYPEGTVNIGEFLALVHGLALLKKQGSLMPVYSDSKTAMKWITTKKANTKLKPSAKNRELFSLVQRAEKWLETNHFSNPVIKWNTTDWGEIPADFGRK